MRAFVLGANQSPHFYRGGGAIAAFRGSKPGDDCPEDWVGSTTTRFGQEGLGLSRLPSGEVLRAAIAQDPEGWLGPRHVRRFGANPALLVKLLDAGQRLSVHCHPTDEFSRRHLDCPFGKTESWVIVETRTSDPAVHLGFRRDVDTETLAGWVERQEVESMLTALHRVPVKPGDAVLVPAGIPHAIGEGVFLVEVQEPTDFSVLLERRGFVVDEARDGRLGLSDELALSCVDRSGWGVERLAELRRERGRGRSLGKGVELALPDEADRFFRMQRVRPCPEARLQASFAVLVVIAGRGSLETESGGVIDLGRGHTVVVPFGAGTQVFRGGLEVIRCLPPEEGDAEDG
jgi:mannose-6-phosphate isomerase